jgi:hypothetical protein
MPMICTGTSLWVGGQRNGGLAVAEVHTGETLSPAQLTEKKPVPSTSMRTRDTPGEGLGQFPYQISHRPSGDHCGSKAFQMLLQVASTVSVLVATSMYAMAAPTTLRS